MSRFATSFVLGFHGWDRSTGEDAFQGNLTLVQSDKEYGWLGPGVYFWENDSGRAMEWAEQKAKRGEYDEPFVISAVIDLGNCLDLLVRENLELLRWSHDDLAARQEAAGLDMPVNEDARGDRNKDKLLRKLDCAVIKISTASSRSSRLRVMPTSGCTCSRMTPSAACSPREAGSIRAGASTSGATPRLRCG